MTLNLHRSHIGATEFDGVQTYGNPSAFFGLAAIGFIDLLGFSASARTNWNDGEDSPLGRLLRIKEIAEQSSETTIAVVEDKTLPPKAKKAFKSRIHTVSDSIVVSNALPPDEVHGDDLAYSLASLFIAIGIIWERSLVEGYTIRGAVEFGQIYWTPAETIGPAFLDCYEYENKAAQWSRVIIGPSLLKLISRLPASPDPVTNFLAVSRPDNVIELSPSRLATAPNIVRLEELATAAGAARDKYDPLLRQLREGCLPVTPADVGRGIAMVHEKIRRVTSGGLSSTK